MIGSIWRTTEQLTKEDGVDLQIKTTLKELITYLLFFVVLIIGDLIYTIIISCIILKNGITGGQTLRHDYN